MRLVWCLVLRALVAFAHRSLFGPQELVWCLHVPPVLLSYAMSSFMLLAKSLVFPVAGHEPDV